MTGGRTLTVLVADVVESTRINAGLGQERADEVRRMIFSRFSDATHEYDGRVVKTMGDAVLSTFNGATEAVSSGLAMIASLDRLARQVTGLKLRVGVAVGDVTEEDDDVFGHAVVVASRLSKQAAPGQVLATDLVRDLAIGRGKFEWERVGDLFLKGIEQPIATSAALARREETTRLRMPHALRSRPGEVFVGRTDQLEVLRLARKEAATQQHRRAVLVAGEPGVGKTRLVAASARRSDDEGGLVLFARCAEDLAVPYQPFADALRTSVQHAPSDLLAAHFEACGGELRRLFPTLRNAPPLDEASPDIERLRLFEAVSDFIERLAEEHPVTLVLDDIQWAAPATLHMLKHLIMKEDPAALCVVATYRDSEVDRHHPLGVFLGDVSGVPSVERISLDGLDESEMEWLCEAISGDELDEGGVQLAAALYHRTNGNPFFATQILRHWAEAGALVHGAEGWEASTTDLELPDGVLDVVGRRLERLTPATAEALSLASVIGVTFTHAVLARAMGGEDVEPALKEAVRARLLNDNGRDGYTFVHAIVRDALVDELTSTARAKKHRAIGLALLDIYGEREGAHVHDLAFHFTEAAPLGDAEHAVRFARLASDEAIRRADVPGAIAILERCWHRLDEAEPIDHEQRFLVCNRLAELHFRRVDGVVDALEAAAASARILSSPEKMVQLSFSAYRWDIGVDDPFPLQLVEDALALLLDGPSPTRAGAYASLAYLHDMQSTGHPQKWHELAVATLDELGGADDDMAEKARAYSAFSLLGQPGAARMRDLLAELPEPDPSDGFRSAIYWTSTVDVAARLGDRTTCDNGMAMLTKQLEHKGEPTAGAYASHWRVIAALRDGLFAEVPQRMNEAMPEAGVVVPNVAASYAVWNMWLAYEEGRSAEIVDGLKMMSTAMGAPAAMSSPLAVHLCELGRYDDAAIELDYLRGRFDEIGRNASWGTITALMATAAAWLNDSAVGEIVLPELDKFSGEIIILPAVVILGAADTFRGQVLLALGRYDDAVAAIEAGIALEQQFAAPPMLARSQYWLGRAARAAGDETKAYDAFVEAKRLATDLGMALVAEHAAEALAI